MNARIRPKDQVTNKQKKVVAEYLKEEQERQAKDVMRRWYKLMCTSLNDDFGFGKERLLRLIDRISKLAEEHITDEVFWEHMDKRLEQMGVQFEKENYAEMERLKWRKR